MISQGNNEATPKRVKWKPDIGYLPTPAEVVEAMLTLAEVTSDDILYDLGSGDGRILITAAQRFGTQGVGIDIDPKRVRQGFENAQRSGVGDRVTFLQQDLFESDFSEATIVILYLLPHLNLKLRPTLLAQLSPGTRILSHDFDMGDWQPDRVVEVQSEDPAILYLWRI
ncbi:SAM-dependent methyltransferase [Phormidesmis sp. 146-12]